uniref:Uncharacterized protein n=1 Tax=Romanomermis culicivorax TaxID=13658 RepID=A0A915L7W7_ROMCU
MGVDCMGPMTITEKGNQFIVVFMDHFTNRLSLLASLNLGAFIGYISCNQYDALIFVIRKLSDEEKHQLEEKVQVLVGSNLLEDLTKFVQDEVNRQLFLNAVTEMFKGQSDEETQKY